MREAYQALWWLPAVNCPQWPMRSAGGHLAGTRPERVRVHLPLPFPRPAGPGQHTTAPTAQDDWVLPGLADGPPPVPAPPAQTFRGAPLRRSPRGGQDGRREVDRAAQRSSSAEAAPESTARNPVPGVRRSADRSPVSPVNAATARRR